MKVEKVKIEVVKPYWRNPRKNDKTVKALKKSIKKYGYNVPIVVDEDYVIITGHARYRALIELGYKEVYVIKKTDLTEKQKALYRIEDNKVSEFAEWDLDKLERELLELKDIDKLIYDFGEFYQDGLFKEVDKIAEEFYGIKQDEEINSEPSNIANVDIIESSKGNSEQSVNKKSNTQDKKIRIECPFCGCVEEYDYGEIH